MYNLKLKLRSFKEKKNLINFLSCRRVCITLASVFKHFFKVRGRWVYCSDCFFHAEQEYQSLFFITSSFSKIACQKAKNNLNYRCFPIVITLCPMKFFNIFFCSRSGVYGGIWHHMKFIRFLAQIFKEVA